MFKSVDDLCCTSCALYVCCSPICSCILYSLHKGEAACWDVEGSVKGEYFLVIPFFFFFFKCSMHLMPYCWH